MGRQPCARARGGLSLPITPAPSASASPRPGWQSPDTGTRAGYEASHRPLLDAWFLRPGPPPGQWRKSDRNQAPCASAPDQVLPALWPLGWGAHGGTRQATASFPQGQALATLTERPRAESSPCHVVAVGPRRHPLPCFIHKSKMNLIQEPAL